MEETKAAGTAALVASTVSSNSANAVDWELLYSLNESLRASDNIRLQPDPEDIALSSSSLFGLEFKTHTRTVDWTLGGDLGYVAYFGSKADIPNPDTIVTYSA